MDLFSVLIVIMGSSVLVSWFLAAVRGYRARARTFRVYPRHVTPFVSVLIPAWNERRILERCVAGVKRLEYRNWECIIIAGGPDGTREYAQGLVAGTLNFQVIPQGEGGKNAALNDGLRLAKGHILVLLDADCEVEPGWLGALVAPITAGVDASLGNYFAAPATFISLQFEMDKISAYFIRGATTLTGGAIAISRTALDRLGGHFAESVIVGTDWDLNASLERIGASKVFVPTARHKTPRPATWRQYVKNEIRWRRAHFLSILRSWSPQPAEWGPCLMGLVPYLVGMLLIAIPITMPIVYLLYPTVSTYLAWSWILYVVWIMSRRIGQVIEVAAYSRNWRWLRLFWVPPTTLIVNLCCCVIALISLRRISPHFQGYRPPRIAENQHG